METLTWTLPLSPSVVNDVLKLPSSVVEQAFKLPTVKPAMLYSAVTETLVANPPILDELMDVLGVAAIYTIMRLVFDLVLHAPKIVLQILDGLFVGYIGWKLFCIVIAILEITIDVMKLGGIGGALVWLLA